MADPAVMRRKRTEAPTKVHKVVVHRLGDLEQFAGHMVRLV